VTSGVDIFAQANELDVEMAQFVEHFQEMANASRHPIERGYKHDVEAMPPSISQQLIESRSLRSAPRNDVCVFVGNFISILFGHFAQVEQLCFKMLVSSAHACVSRGALRQGRVGVDSTGASRLLYFLFPRKQIRVDGAANQFSNRCAGFLG
jgi:hypothetical protein